MLFFGDVFEEKTEKTGRNILKKEDNYSPLYALFGSILQAA
jgi:hypothetical protein